MMKPSVSTPGYHPHHDKPFGPATIEHATAECGLDELGTYFMEFHSSGLSDPWTVQYEETIYVIEGRARLLIHEGAATREVVTNAGGLIVIPKGTTLQYGALVAVDSFCPSRQ